MRHHPFTIDLEARNRWVEHMTAALEDSDAPPIIQAEMLDYFDRAATAMINSNPVFRQ